MNRTKTITAAALCALCILPLFAGASAEATQVYPFSGVSFGPGGPGVGTFSRVEAVGVDQITEDVYVYDATVVEHLGVVVERGRLYKFNADGEPAAFSGLGGSNFIGNVGSTGYAEEQIAIDDSNGPDKGDIYVSGNREVKVFSPAGELLGELSGGEMCGVAVGADGHVYVGIYPDEVRQYVPTANPVTNADYVSSLSGLNEACNVSVDGQGNIFAVVWTGGVHRYASSQFNATGESAVASPTAPFDEVARTITSGPTGASVFVDDLGSIAEYSDTSRPELLTRFGATEPGKLTESFGLAVNNTTGEVYAGNSTTVDIYGPPETLPPPTVEDEPPVLSGLTRTTAQVTGTVDPENNKSSLVIEYVSDGEYRSGAANPYVRGASSPNVTLEALSADESVGPIALEGLTAGTTYHYRLAAHSIAGTSYSQDRTFTTAPPTPPGVSTGAAGEVTQTSALLSGTVEAQALQTSYEFEVGTDTSYSGAKLFGNAGRSAGAETVSAGLQYLVPGTTYHYRLVATNEDGTIYGQDMTFTTPGVPTPIAQPPTAPLVASPAVAFPTIPAASKSSATKKKPKRSVKSKKKSARKRAKAKHASAKRAASHARHTKGGSGR
jgi:hypothetical protein